MERLQVFNLYSSISMQFTIFTINHTVAYTCNIINQDFQWLKQVFIAYYVPTAYDLHVMVQIATAIDGTVIITVSVVLVTTILVLILLISCCCCCYYCYKKKSERKGTSSILCVPECLLHSVANRIHTVHATEVNMFACFPTYFCFTDCPSSTSPCTGITKSNPV